MAIRYGFNSKALDLAGITKDTPDPSAGVIVRDAQGEATGVLKESAQALIDKVIPEPTRAEKALGPQARYQAGQPAWQTSVCEAG